MARKSRKVITQAKVYYPQIYNAAGYIRLSVAKDYLPLDSIENQKKIIEHFASDSSNIVLQQFYIDAKVSGTTFERKAFNEMLEDLSKGKIDCVIVKDLSRFGRDLIETGYYIEMYFPKRNVRFISINEKIDTLDGITDRVSCETLGTKISLTNLVNEEYTNDIRRKTQSSIDILKNNGKYVAPRPPYGYKKSSEDCHMIIQDLEAAEVVKKIFSMVIDKVSVNEIVRKLNSSKILPPIDYAKANGLQGEYKQGNGLWNTRTVRHILTNRTYSGDLIQGKNRYVSENTHEAIVSKEMFNTVQDILNHTTSEKNYENKLPAIENMLKGKVVCGSCGGKLQRRKKSKKNLEWFAFFCITNNRLGEGHCAGNYIRESSIVNAIKDEMAKYIETSTSISESYEKETQSLEEEAASIKNQIIARQNNHRRYYEKYVQGEITAEGFKQYKTETENLRTELSDIEAAIENLKEKCKSYQLFTDVLSEKDSIDIVVKKYLNYVIVHDHKQLEVHFGL